MFQQDSANRKYKCRVKILLVINYYLGKGCKVGGAVASWLVSSTPDRAVIALCSWARQFTGEFNDGGNPAMD